MSWLLGVVGFLCCTMAIASVAAGEDDVGLSVLFYVGFIFLAMWAVSLETWQRELLDALRKRNDKADSLTEYDKFVEKAHEIWGEELPPNVAQDLLNYKRAIDGRVATYKE